MQFLSRTSKSRIHERGVYGQTVLDLHRQLSQILRRRTGRSDYGALLAEPARNRSNGEIVWYTRLDGEIRPWTELSQDEQAHGKASIDAAAGEMLRIAREYQDSGDRTRTADADAFLAALGFDKASGSCEIDYTKAFLVGGTPVLTEWGCDAADGTRHTVWLSNVVGTPGAQEPAPAVAAGFATPAAPAAAALTSHAALPAWWRGIWFLFALLFALTILSLLVRGCAQLGLEPPAPTLGGFFVEPRISIAEASLNEERALRTEIADLGARLDEQALQCLSQPDDLPAPEPEPPPLTAIEEPAFAAPRITAPTAECPVIRTSEVALVLDASLSMRWDFNADPRLEARLNANDAERTRLRQRLQEISERGDLAAVLREGMQGSLRLQTLEQESERLFAQLDNSVTRPRIDVAKAAIETLVAATDPEVHFGYIAFNQCGVRQPYHRFGPDQRAALLNTVRATQLDSNTALAQTLHDLPRRVTGGRTEDQPVNVVLLADGDNNCPGNPCTQAAALKKERPYLFINTIAIGRNAGAVRCVSEATGGRFIEVSDAPQLARELAVASGQELPAHCVR